MTHQSLDDIEKSLKRQDEGFMKFIERLDSMVIFHLFAILKVVYSRFIEVLFLKIYDIPLV